MRTRLVVRHKNFYALSQFMLISLRRLILPCQPARVQQEKQRSRGDDSTPVKIAGKGKRLMKTKQCWKNENQNRCEHYSGNIIYSVIDVSTLSKCIHSALIYFTAGVRHLKQLSAVPTSAGWMLSLIL